ncbi:MAG: Arm DNA-binding domain-containing protein [Vicinamibacterales bacterium]
MLPQTDPDHCYPGGSRAGVTPDGRLLPRLGGQICRRSSFSRPRRRASRRIPPRASSTSDLDQPGLALRVTPTGAKSWAVLYRHRGRLRRLTLGALKAIGLAEARTRARTAIAAAADGADPAAAKQGARRVETIADLAADYIEKHAKRKKRSWREDDRMLRADILTA